MNDSVIYDGIRSPFGRYGGGLSAQRPDDLAAAVIRSLLDRNGIESSLVEDVVLGNTNQAGEDCRNVARNAALLAGMHTSVGGVTVIVLTQFVELTGPRPRRLKAELTLANLPKIDSFLSDFAARGKRGEEMTDRLRAVGEEMLLTLTRPAEEGRAPAGRHLLLVARNDGDAVDLEFAATTDDANLEDQLALLSEQVTGPPVEQEVSLRLLRHYASSVRHQQFHDTDVITVRVSPTASM